MLETYLNINFMLRRKELPISSVWGSRSPSIVRYCYGCKKYSTASICPICKTRLLPSPKRCECGTLNPGDKSFCENCSRELTN